MKILDIQLQSKTVGITILISSILILLSSITLFFVLTSFGISSGVNILYLIPFILISAFVLLISSLGIYIGIRYIKDKGFKKNNVLGVILIAFGLFYFLSSLASYILSNLTDNPGGWLRPIFAFIFMLIAVPLGIVIKNGVK